MPYHYMYTLAFSERITINQRLILKPKFLFIVLLFIPVIALGIPFVSRASIVSLDTSSLSAEEDSLSSSSDNSQSMPLLQPAINTNPNPYASDSGPTIVSDQALMTSAGPSGTEVDIDGDAQPESDKITLYTVKDGDTLPQIAKLFNISINTILWANNLKSGATIKTGNQLAILPVTGVKYTVKKGDTLESIAKAFSSDASDIGSFNNIDDTTLVAGTDIVIPDGEQTAISPDDSSSESQSTPPKSSDESKIKTAVEGAVKKIIEKVTTTLNNSGSTAIDTTGYFIRPIVGGVRTQGLHGHNAVDLADKIGTPVHAAAAGQVIIAKQGGWNGGYGNYIVISHDNGTQTLYAHLSSVEVSVGQMVTQDQVIGLMGSTGDSTGSHVHFEVRGGKNPF